MSARGSDLLRLRAIVDCADEVAETIREMGVTQESYSFPDGTLERVCRRALDMLVLQLCEEARELTDETRSRMPQIPWRSVAEVRNYFVHGCGSVDSQQVWAILEGDLPALRDACAACAGQIERGEYVPSFGSRAREREAAARATP